MKSLILTHVAVTIALCANLCCAGDQNDSSARQFADVTQGLNNAFIGALNNKTDIQNNAETFVGDLEKALAKTPVNAVRGTRSTSSEELEKLSKNLAGIKELFERAQSEWKKEHFHEAAMLFKSVSLATVPGSDTYVAESRDRLNELEPMAKKRLQSATDEDLRQEYFNEARDLLFIVREFPDTAACRESQRQLSVLRSRPEAAASLDLEQARELEASGKFSEALAQYSAVVANPRYQNTVAIFEARRRAAELNQDKYKHAAVGTEQSAKAEREARALLAASENMLLNKINHAASRKLKEILEAYPETLSAKEAKKLLDENK